MRTLTYIVRILAPVLLAGPVAAADVVVAIGQSLPPYVIAEESRGMELEIVREALAVEGHTLVPRYLPFARVVPELLHGGVDAAMTINESSGADAFYSDSYIAYRNYAISLAGRELHIDSIEDLADRSVVAFQNAGLYLGPAFRHVAESNPRYIEVASQMGQAVMLYSGRVDVVVADKNIFNWYSRDPSVQGRTDTTQLVAYHPIFPPSVYKVAFRDKALRDAFNRGLAQLHASGVYDEIVARYGEQ